MSHLTRTTDLAAILASGPAAAPSAGWALAADLLALTKPRITFMVALTAALGFLAAPGTAARLLTPAGLALFLTAVLGTALSCMGASALNQVYERDTDALMLRTRQRPMPAGRVGVGLALAFAVTLALAGVAVLAVAAHPLAAAIAAFTIASYVLAYTPAKRVTPWAVWIGAVPGALPPVIGYAAAGGMLGPAAWCMFALMFLWQVPHFLAIAWMYREDFARAGFPMLPVIDPGGARTFRQMALGALALVPLGTAPALLAVSGPLYLVGALVAGIAFALFALALVWRPSTARARATFLASLAYLPVVLVLMVVDRV